MTKSERHVASRAIADGREGIPRLLREVTPMLPLLEADANALAYGYFAGALAWQVYSDDHAPPAFHHVQRGAGRFGDVLWTVTDRPLATSIAGALNTIEEAQHYNG
jgi:hypothetical protein